MSISNKLNTDISFLNNLNPAKNSIILQSDQLIKVEKRSCLRNFLSWFIHLITKKTRNPKLDEVSYRILNDAEELKNGNHVTKEERGLLKQAFTTLSEIIKNNGGSKSKDVLQLLQTIDKLNTLEPVKKLPANTADKVQDPAKLDASKKAEPEIEEDPAKEQLSPNNPTSSDDKDKEKIEDTTLKPAVATPATIDIAMASNLIKQYLSPTQWQNEIVKSGGFEPSNLFLKASGVLRLENRLKDALVMARYIDDNYYTKFKSQEIYMIGIELVKQTNRPSNDELLSLVKELKDPEWRNRLIFDISNLFQDPQELLALTKEYTEEGMHDIIIRNACEKFDPTSLEFFLLAQAIRNASQRDAEFTAACSKLSLHSTKAPEVSKFLTLAEAIQDSAKHDEVILTALRFLKPLSESEKLQLARKIKDQKNRDELVAKNAINAVYSVEAILAIAKEIHDVNLRHATLKNSYFYRMKTRELQSASKILQNIGDPQLSDAIIEEFIEKYGSNLPFEELLDFVSQNANNPRKIYENIKKKKGLFNRIKQIEERLKKLN